MGDSLRRRVWLQIEGLQAQRSPGNTAEVVHGGSVWREEGAFVQGQGSCVTLKPQLPGGRVSSAAPDGVGGLESQRVCSCWGGRLPNRTER